MSIEVKQTPDAVQDLHQAFLSGGAGLGLPGVNRTVVERGGRAECCGGVRGNCVTW